MGADQRKYPRELLHPELRKVLDEIWDAHRAQHEDA